MVWEVNGHLFCPKSMKNLGMSIKSLWRANLLDIHIKTPFDDFRNIKNLKIYTGKITMRKKLIDILDSADKGDFIKFI